MSGTIRIFLAEALILPTGFITAVFLARKLGPTDYGMFALASVLVLWIEWGSTSLFSHTTIKFVGETSEWEALGTTIVRLHLVTGIGAAILLWVLSSPLSHLFDEPAMAGYLRLYAVDIPIFCLASANSNILVGMGCFKERARISAGRRIARLVLIILFVGMGLSVAGAIMGMIGASIVELIISRLYVRPSLFSKTTFPLRRLFEFAAPLFLSALSLSIFRLDLFALKALGGTAALAGFYGAARNLSIPLAIFSASLSPPLLSTLSLLFGKGEEPKAKKIGLAAMRSVIWLLPFAVMAAGVAPEIVGLIFGEKYLPTGPIFSLLIFAALGLLTVNVARAILTALGKPNWTFALTGPMVPLALIGHLVLIPRLGGIGAAIVTTSVACSAALASLLTVRRIWGVLPPVRTLANSTLCSGIALALAILWPSSGSTIVLKLVVITIIIPLTFLILGELTRKEIASIASLLRRQTGTDENPDPER